MMSTKTILIAAGALLAAGAAASANPILSFSFNQLSSSYTRINSTSGSLSVKSVSTSALKTSGNVKRESVAPTGTATLTTGFAGTSTASFNMDVSLTGITATTATSIGSFEVRDVDAGANLSRITGTIAGMWDLSIPSMPRLNATIASVLIEAGDDGVFNGTSGSFQTTGLENYQLSGILQTLLITLGSNVNFSQDFSDISTTTRAQVIPTPGAAALVGLGGLAATRRRRA